METLDNILNGTSADEPATPEVVAETPPAEAAPAEPAPEPSEPKADALGRLHGEDGKFLPKSEQPAEAAPAVDAAPGAPPAPSEESPTVPRTALLDERKKRQTLEGQLAEMTARINAQAPQPAPQPQAKPDQWDDPDGHDQWVAEQAGTIAEQRAVAAVTDHLIRVSAEAAKTRLPDYMETVPVFEDLATKNPGLIAQMRQHPDPAQFAYDVVKQHEEFSKYGSLDEMKAALKAEWEATALEELKAKLPAPSVPPTLSGERSVGSRTGPEWSGPKTLADILQ